MLVAISGATTKNITLKNIIKERIRKLKWHHPFCLLPSRVAPSEFSEITTFLSCLPYSMEQEAEETLNMDGLFFSKQYSLII